MQQHRTHHDLEKRHAARVGPNGGRIAVAATSAMVALLAAVGTASATITPLVQTGTPSPIGWIFSGLSGGSVDGVGRAVFAARSSAVLTRSGSVITQLIGPGTALGGGRTLIGANAPTIDANGCVVARALVDDGRQAIVRSCGGSSAVLVQSGDGVAGGTTIRSIGTSVFATGAETLAFSGILSDGSNALLRRDGSGIVVVATTGQSAPTGGIFTSFRLAGVSGAGRVAFFAAVSQGPNGLFAATDTSLTTIVQVGQASPSGSAFSALSGASVNAADLWAFRATLSSGLAGIFLVNAAVGNPPLTTIALQGDAAPIPQATFRGFPSSTVPAITDGGSVAFRGLLEGSAESAGIFVATPGLSLVAVATTRRQTAVGLLSQVRDPVIAEDGSVVVPASVTGGGPGLYTARDGTLSPLAQFGATTTSDVLDTRFRFSSPDTRTTAESAVFVGERDGIFRQAGTGLVEVVAYTGQRTPIDGFFADFGIPVVDGRNRIVFGGSVHQGAVREAVFAYGDRGLEVLAAPGDRAGGGRFSDFFPSGVDDLARPGAGGRGVALVAALEGTSADEGVFVFNGAHPRLVTKSGRRVPGGRLGSFGTPALGPRTQVAFVAQVGTQRRHAVVTKVGGGLRVVARLGAETKTRVEGQFVGFAPPAMADVGAVFRATLSGGPAQEALFLARGRSLAVLATTTDTTTDGTRLASIGDPTVSGNVVYVFVRLAGEQGTGGLYRISADELPTDDTPPLLTPVLHAGDPSPAGLDGQIVRIDQPGTGPNGSVAAVIELADAPASNVLAWIQP